jgi:hypothetical protein
MYPPKPPLEEVIFPYIKSPLEEVGITKKHKQANNYLHI